MMNYVFNTLFWQGICQIHNSQNQTSTHINVPLYYYNKHYKNINYEYS